MAEWPYGTADWLDPAGMSRPYRRLRRATPAPRASIVYGLLQQREDTPFADQGCAGPAGYSGRRAHSSNTNSRRITPSVCSDLISDRDRPYHAGFPTGWRVLIRYRALLVLAAAAALFHFANVPMLWLSSSEDHLGAAR